SPSAIAPHRMRLTCASTMIPPFDPLNLHWHLGGSARREACARPTSGSERSDVGVLERPETGGADRALVRADVRGTVAAGLALDVEHHVRLVDLLVVLEDSAGVVAVAALQPDARPGHAFDVVVEDLVLPAVDPQPHGLGLPVGQDVISGQLVPVAVTKDELPYR